MGWQLATAVALCVMFAHLRNQRVDFDALYGGIHLNRSLIPLSEHRQQSSLDGANSGGRDVQHKVVHSVGFFRGIFSVQFDREKSIF